MTQYINDPHRVVTSGQCFCTGPQKGEPECPCAMKAKQLSIMHGNPASQPKQGWICPRCGTVNGPIIPTCMNAPCNPMKVTA